MKHPRLPADGERQAADLAARRGHTLPLLDGRDHFAADDDFWADEEEGDDVKLLGVYSSREKAQERIVRARPLPGFRDEPECFYIEEFTVDADEWKDGFVTVMTGGEGSEETEKTD